MTIDEMRDLHRHALGEAQAKQTELRLVLASRYRELVGSSDEVTKMRERAQELHELVNAIPDLMNKLVDSSNDTIQESKAPEEAPQSSDQNDEQLSLRHKLSKLPRLVHRALDNDDVHEAADYLLDLFRVIAEQTDEYPLASALAKGVKTSNNTSSDPILEAQTRMTFLHVQSLPAKITRISRSILESAASFGSTTDPRFGAFRSASALSSLDIFDISQTRDRPMQLLDLYFNSKAQLMQNLLSKLTVSPADKKELSGEADATSAEQILSKIVLILQYDVVLHSYQIFVLRNFPVLPGTHSSADAITKSLPMFTPSLVQAKVSHFLSAHLPLIRTRVKNVLVQIAGTTASALGKIRQSLYDKTDGVECIARLNSTGVCTWSDAVGCVVDVKNVLNSSHMAGSSSSYAPGTTEMAGSPKFSLWGLLFSNTFSSLVHSLLTTSFQSVHSRVVSRLSLSLANAPPLGDVLPHEAYRNTLHITSELDAALLKVGDDAHELLVHAEEREQSERRLRQSLYVQTCEIMGRLICELRRMLVAPGNPDSVRELILGRLCYLLKFRLTALPTLLDSASSPAALDGASGMISILDLSSAFELADDNDDGLITFQEATVAVDSAFAGTQFQGGEVVRETLLLSPSLDKEANLSIARSAGKPEAPRDVTLNELTLLLARGLRHDQAEVQSALAIIQSSLDAIVAKSFRSWAAEISSPSTLRLSQSLQQFVGKASKCDEEEYRRIYYNDASPETAGGNISPHILVFLMDLAHSLNCSICPSDSMSPVPSKDYAKTLGINDDMMPSAMEMIRWALLAHGLETIIATFETALRDKNVLSSCNPLGLVQLKSDLTFIGKCFLRRNKFGFGPFGSDRFETALKKVSKEVDVYVRRKCDKSVLSKIERAHIHVSEVCDLYLSSLFGEEGLATAPVIDTPGIAMGESRAASDALFEQPLPSTCRFSLLPIQSDKTLSGVQARGKYKERQEVGNRHGAVGTGAVRAGLGFFSSMLKKN